MEITLDIIVVIIIFMIFIINTIIYIKKEGNPYANNDNSIWSVITWLSITFTGVILIGFILVLLAEHGDEIILKI